jgi:predicted O-methyltransferase YrrM
LGVIGDPLLESLLAVLHARSDAQAAAIAAFELEGASHPQDEETTRAFRSDKFVALDRDKAEFCYQLCRATKARRVVEIGTSYGVSTLYLAAAVRDNVKGTADRGVVIGTEYEAAKATAAKAHFAQAGLRDYIDLREGDLRETLRDIPDPVDFVLMDVWVRMARPALELIFPHLRPGAVVVCDNTQARRADYADYFAFLSDPSNGFKTMTLPFSGGLELSVCCGS